MSITPETLAWLRQSAKFDGAVTAQVLLNLLERVEALEQEPTCKQALQVPPTPEAVPVATDKKQPSPPHIAITYQPKSVYQPLRPAQPPAPQPAPPPEAAPVATDEELLKLWIEVDGCAAKARRACYNFGRQHGAAQLLSLEKELERERLRLAACGVVAMADTPESAAKARDICPDFWSASLDDVIRQVDALMEARAAQPASLAALSDALIKAECALSDIAEGEETNDAPNTFEWAEQRCAKALDTIRPVMRDHGIRTSECPPAAQPAPPPAPAGGLVERVAAAIADEDAPVDLWHDDARAAIREVAAWMRDHEHAFNAAYWLELEVDR